MKNKLIKVSDTHYIVVDDSKITHSTLPLVHPDCCIAKEGITNMNKGCSERNRCLGDVQIISLSEVEEAINGYSVDKKCCDDLGLDYDQFQPKQFPEINKWMLGFKAHQELVKDKLFSIEDMRKAIKMAQEESWDEGGYLGLEHNPAKIIQSLLPKTEWNIEFVDGKIKLI